MLRDAEEVIREREFSLDDMRPCPLQIDEVVKITGQGTKFIGIAVPSGTRFDPYTVTGELFPATSYNDYVRRIVARASALLAEPLSARHLKKEKKFPVVQVQEARIAALVDRYIRERLFGRPFDPFEGEQWRMLFLKDVCEHSLREVGRAIAVLQEMEPIGEPEVLQRKLSGVGELRMREGLSVPTVKTMYERTGYPGRNGGLEKAFIEFADTDASVEAFAKLWMDKHYFVRFRYVSAEGMIRHYYPDFLVRTTSADTFIIETKAEDQVASPNVERKKVAALAWCDRINALPPEHRSNSTWHYVLLGEELFYSWRDREGSMAELLAYAQLRPKKGTLF